MLIKKNATMIGEFTDRGPKLFTEKAAGNVCGCIGFVQDKNTKLNVPNTLLKKDIRDVKMYARINGAAGIALGIFFISYYFLQFSPVKLFIGLFVIYGITVLAELFTKSV